MGRNQFEEWFKTTLSYAIFEDSNVWKVDLFAFNEPTNSYLHSGVQAAFESWQHQQAKVEELQKQVKDLDKRATQYALDEMATAKLNGELQKRVDALKALAISWVSEAESDECLSSEDWVSNVLNRCAEELEQALKGEV
ncbi:hypothetical protein [Acinetobacter lactucae]|uniref:Uncharacterized protein n=1 Tax=Acinetobacter lactucae TaxID=1785128 RepID=R8YW80_9GAMM|nr:hypothetical protein [Acinetobacter lactucae]EOQ73499.1 hypothetical protein F929_03442 [Acinetobacter lactucae]